MAMLSSESPPFWPVAFVLCMISLDAGSTLAAESYIVRYQDSFFSSYDGEVVFVGATSPIVLAGNAATFQVETTKLVKSEMEDIGGESNLIQGLWNQSINVDNPKQFRIEHNFGYEDPFRLCMTVDADTIPGSILSLDLCSDDTMTITKWFQFFEFRNHVQPQRASIKSRRKLPKVVMIKPVSAIEVDNDICISAGSTLGTYVTLEICNYRDVNQRFLVNASSFRLRRPRSIIPSTSKNGDF